MKKMAIGNFKATCLKVLDNIHNHKEPLIITKRGKPIVRIIPENQGNTESLVGSVIFEEDIISPALNEKEWNSCL